MKKIILQLFLLMLVPFSVMAAPAQTASSMLSTMAAKFRAYKSIVAQYALTADGHTQRGTLVVAGDRFSVSSPAVSVWYDGRTQWTYSPQIGEVNITTPSPQELAQVNPFAIIKAFERNYVASFQGQKILLKARSAKSEIRQVLIDFNRKTMNPTKVTLRMTSGETITIAIASVKDGGMMKSSAFAFNPKLLPKSTQIVDLR